MRLLEIRQDPISHFLPTKVTNKGSYFFAGPPGLAPELAEMFMKPLFNVMNSKRRANSPEKPSSKRARIEGSVNEEEDLEQARRAATPAHSLGIGSDVMGRASVGPGVNQDSFEFADNTGTNDYPVDLGMDAAVDMYRERSKSRLSTPAPDGEFPIDEGTETFADSTCPIAIFDERQSQTQTQGTQTQEKETAEGDGKGYSKSTVKALAIARKELHPTPDGPEKVMSFQQMSHKV